MADTTNNIYGISSKIVQHTDIINHHTIPILNLFPQQTTSQNQIIIVSDSEINQPLSRVELIPQFIPNSVNWKRNKNESQTSNKKRCKRINRDYSLRTVRQRKKIDSFHQSNTDIQDQSLFHSHLEEITMYCFKCGKYQFSCLCAKEMASDPMCQHCNNHKHGQNLRFKDRKQKNNSNQFYQSMPQFNASNGTMIDTNSNFNGISFAQKTKNVNETTHPNISFQKKPTTNDEYNLWMERMDNTLKILSVLIKTIKD